MQHGLFDRTTLEAAIAVVPPHVPCLVRVEDDSATAIGRALDAGAEGRHRPADGDRKAGRACRGGGPFPAERPSLRRRDQATPSAGLHGRGFRRHCRRADDRDEDRTCQCCRDCGGEERGLRLHRNRRPRSFPRHATRQPRALQSLRDDPSRLPQGREPCGIFTMSPEAAAARMAEGYRMAVVANDVSAVGDAFSSRGRGLQGGARKEISAIHLAASSL